MYFLTVKYTVYLLAGHHHFLGKNQFNASLRGIRIYMVITLIILALISAKSALERLAFQLYV
jgi:hypothetical protein